MLVKTYSASVQGLNAQQVTIEVNLARGIRFCMVGLPDNAVKESHERIVAAVENSGYKFPAKQITINLAPADIRKEGSGYDLPIAIGIMAAEKEVETTLLERTMLVGELSLDGSLQPVKGVLPIAIKARELGYENLIVPNQNVREAAVVNRVKVYGLNHISEVVNFLNGKDAPVPYDMDTRKEFFEQQCDSAYDMADVKGQESVKLPLPSRAPPSPGTAPPRPPRPCSLRGTMTADRKSTRLNSSHMPKSRMPSSA